MSVPPDQLMSMISKGKDGANEPLPSTEGAPAPMASPMSTPEPKMGNREGALIALSHAMDLIEQALPALNSESEEGQNLLKVMGLITKVIGPRKDKARELQGSEVLQMLQALPQGGGSTPEGQALSKAPMIPNMPPVPGAAPGGSPSSPM
jgi:hypothetical protein